MDEIRENELELRRRQEAIVRKYEHDEVKLNEAREAIRRKSQTNKRSIGPANDLLRFIYILEQQYQNDNNDVRAKAREDVLGYLEQFRPSDNVAAEEDDDQQPEESDESQPSEIITLSNPMSTQAMPPLSQLPSAVPSFTQPSPVALSTPQLQQVVSSPLQPSSAASRPQSTQSRSVIPTQPQLSAPEASLSPVTDPSHIAPQTLLKYEKLLFEAQQYAKCYATVDATRKAQLTAPLKSILNKLREHTFEKLTKELLQYLKNLPESNQTTRVSNDNERLLCLSILATLILAQLLGGDMTDIKTAVFIPLVHTLSSDPDQKEFGTIFLDRLHKKCPYTVPLYPKREPTMTDIQYKLAMGYMEKQDGNQQRLETKDEFLVRMNGLIRLFCKLLVKQIPPFDKDVQFRWTWCADIANLPPRPDLTIILLRICLQEVGDDMLKIYPVDFPKIIGAIRRNSTKLEQGSSGSEISRFRTALEDFP